MQRETWEDPTGVYIIRVAARLLEMHPQTLRKYERAGFLTPTRTIGMQRLYSAEDITRLRLIKHLVENMGLNLAGVELGLKVATHVLQMERDLATTKDSAELRKNLQKSLGGIEALLGLSTAPPPSQTAKRSVHIEIRTEDR